MLNEGAPGCFIQPVCATVPHAADAPVREAAHAAAAFVHAAAGRCANCASAVALFGCQRGVAAAVVLLAAAPSSNSWKHVAPKLPRHKSAATSS